MIRRLRRKMMVITMCSAFAVLFVLLASVNLIYAYLNYESTQTAFDTLIEYNGRFPTLAEGKRAPEEKNPEMPFKTRYFSVKTDSSGAIQFISTDKVASVKTYEAITMTSTVLSKGKPSGTVGFYRYTVTEKYYGKLLVFIDCREQMETARVLAYGSTVLLFFVMLALFVPVYFLSKRAAAPIAESYEKQKQFITDAGHELKTPLAIISANTDVIEMCSESSEWTQGIHQQVKRMDVLVKNLIVLSRMDEDGAEKTFSVFSLSEAVTDSASQFTTLADARSCDFVISVQPDIKYNGNAEAIKRLVSVLCDNAVKYSPDNGKISLELHKKGKNVFLTVANDCEYIDTENLNRLFDRFYRADSSRSRDTGGYGIGLSIAKAIVEAHNGKIKAESADGRSIVFTVTL